MDVKNIRWVGVPTANYDEMVRFLTSVLGLRVAFEEQTTIEVTTSEGDAFQVMAPGHPYFDLFTEHANGPVPLFEVDDFDEACKELRGAGVQIVGPVERDSTWQWINFRAPDGHLYGLTARLR
jgi:catechol 2,3-dioxygenase-like lactoylglutathione lyase family enzyme